MQEGEGGEPSPSKLRKLNKGADGVEDAPRPMNVDGDEVNDVPLPVNEYEEEDKGNGVCEGDVVNVPRPVKEYEDKDVPRLLWSVPLLPYGAWARWGSQAVYFAAEIDGVPGADGSTEYGGLSIYAINPTDEYLSVYHVFDFAFPNVFGRVICGLSCAIVGSSVYVAGNGRLWTRQMGDKDRGWVDGPQFSTSDRAPQLFSLGGRLYALCYFSLSDLGRDASPESYPDAFVVLVDGSWRSLCAPPPCFWCSGEGKSFELYWLAGWSCIGDCTMIVHVMCRETKRQRFYRFQHSDDFVGSWTELNVSVLASPSPSPFPCEDVTYCSHVNSDDALLLPILSRATMFPVFGLGAEPAGDRLQLEVGEEIPLPWQPILGREHDLPWHLISLDQSRYCAIAFTTTNHLNLTVFTFDLHLAGATASAIMDNVQDHAFGRQRPCDLMSGKAYFSSPSC